jgi:hypothetical protein
MEKTLFASFLEYKLKNEITSLFKTPAISRSVKPYYHFNNLYLHCFQGIADFIDGAKHGVVLYSIGLFDHDHRINNRVR